MAVVVACLSMVLIYCMARTIAVQRTIRTLDLFRRETSEDPAGTRTQTVVLLGIYLTRLNSAFLVGILVYLVTSRPQPGTTGPGLSFSVGLGVS